MNAKSLPPPPRKAETPAPSLARISDRLTEAIDLAAVESRFASSGRAVRSDGWTPERVRIFLQTLAECGTVTEAARAAGMTARSAYALRQRAEARAFHVAWNAALHLAGRRLADELMARAMNGSVELLVRDGEIVAERHRHDNGLAMALLRRLDQQHQLLRDEIVDSRAVAEEFDEFLDIVCDGGEGAADFIVERRPFPKPSSKEASLMTRLAAYIARKAKP